MSGNSGGGREAEVQSIVEWNGTAFFGIPQRFACFPKCKSQITQGCTWCGVLELPCEPRNHGFGQPTSQP